MITRTTTYLKTTRSGKLLTITQTYTVYDEDERLARKREYRRKQWANRIAGDAWYRERHIEREMFNPLEIEAVREAYEEYLETFGY